MADRQMVSVDAKALRTILEALNGPAHHIREIQMTRSVAGLTGDDPIGTLIDDFNLAVVGGGPPRCKHCAGTGYEPAASVAPSADAERLDWLQGFADVRLEAWFADGDVTRRVTRKGRTIGSGRTLREAIDDARAACPRGPADADGVRVAAPSVPPSEPT